MTSTHTPKENPFTLTQEEQDIILRYRASCQEGKRMIRCASESVLRHYPAKKKTVLSIVKTSDKSGVHHA